MFVSLINILSTIVHLLKWYYHNYFKSVVQISFKLFDSSMCFSKIESNILCLICKTLSIFCVAQLQLLGTSQMIHLIFASQCIQSQNYLGQKKTLQCSRLKHSRLFILTFFVQLQFLVGEYTAVAFNKLLSTDYSLGNVVEASCLLKPTAMNRITMCFVPNYP